MVIKYAKRFEGKNMGPVEITDEIRRHFQAPIKKEISLKDMYPDSTIVVETQTTRGAKYESMCPEVAEWFLRRSMS